MRRAVVGFGEVTKKAALKCVVSEAELATSGKARGGARGDELGAREELNGLLDAFGFGGPEIGDEGLGKEARALGARAGEQGDGIARELIEVFVQEVFEALRGELLHGGRGEAPLATVMSEVAAAGKDADRLGDLERVAIGETGDEVERFFGGGAAQEECELLANAVVV